VTVTRVAAAFGRGLRTVTVALLVAVVFAMVLLLLGVVPLRSYQAQRQDLDATRQRVTMLRERNARLDERSRLLRTDTEIARVARQQFGMVKPGQTLVLAPGLRETTADRVRKTPSRGKAILETLLFWR
jgi:cell division protein FtsB